MKKEREEERTQERNREERTAREMTRMEERGADRERTLMQLKRELSSNKKELNAYRLKDTRSALEKAVSGTSFVLWYSYPHDL